MSRYRGQLPQLDQRMFLTDSGLETTLIFHDGYDLPHFAAFVLLDDEKGRERLDRYFREHAQVAAGVGAGVVLESVTWRASPDWAELLGLSSDQLADANRAAIDQLDRLRAGMGDDRAVVSAGASGPVVTGTTAPRGWTRMMRRSTTPCRCALSPTARPTWCTR